MTDGDGTDKQPLAGDCASAFLLLSRIPVTWYSFPDDRPPDFISSLWAFPLVGLVIGGSGGLVMLAGQLLTLPPVVAAVADGDQRLEEHRVRLHPLGPEAPA